ncbi:MAG: flagellar biosynthesis protein FlhF [Humidesulfovibrio sp.]|nr:flagellar biosynthesis protein FlhF [Humidesulfovibrio sp.]
MHVKTFKGSDIQAALAKVKAELGEEAIILGTKTVRGGAGKSCEITAAIDPRSAGGPSKNAPLMPARNAGGIMPQMDGNPTDWACEWRQIKDQLMALVKPQLNMEDLSPRQRVAIKYLEREEADMQVLLRVFLELKADPDRPILPVLESVAPCYGFESNKWRQKFHIFAGPHGVGKTLTLIRLALREKQARPKARICVVAADQGQGKGRLVLRHYADLSGLAFREAGSAEDMQELLKEAHKFDMIFVDLPGLSGKSSLAEHLADLGLAESLDMAAHLVLAPYFAASQYAEIARRYMCPQLQSLIWTKLDEACSFGALLNMARLTELPVSALSFGSGLKNSIAPASSDLLWRLIFKHTLPGQSAEQAA